MNIGRSVKLLLIKHDKNQIWLSEQLEVSANQASKFACKPHASGESIEKLAKVFDMTASDFIAVGESDD
jgi:hypothetical protein